MNEVSAIKDKRTLNRFKASLHGRNRLLLILGINTGLRVSDLLALTVKDVRGQDAVKVRESKTGKTRRFVLNDAAKTAISELVPADAPDGAPLFPSRKGGRAISRVQAYRVLNDGAKRAGVKGAIGAHSLRKTFGYFAYNQGADIALLMRIFKHSSQSVTLRYIGVEQDEEDAVYATVNL